MKPITLLFLCVAAVALAGCGKPTVVESAPLDRDGLPVPTKAQPKLPTLKLYVGPETLDAEMAVTPMEEKTGMMFRTNIQDSDAMIFDLHMPTQASFWMKNCPESISAAYITPDGVIAEIHRLLANDTNPVLSAEPNIQYVLETSDGWFARHHVTTGMAITTENGPLSQAFNQR